MFSSELTSNAAQDHRYIGQVGCVMCGGSREGWRREEEERGNYRRGHCKRKEERRGEKKTGGPKPVVYALSLVVKVERGIYGEKEETILPLHELLVCSAQWQEGGPVGYT